MTDPSTKHPPGVDDLLAPPPFGVAETTGDQLLPIATSMEHVLDEDRAPLPQPEPEPDPGPVIVATPQPKAEPSVPEPAEAPAAAVVDMDIDEPAPGSNRTIVIVAAVVLLLGVGGFLWMNRGGETTPAPAGEAKSGAVAAADGGAPENPSDAPLDSVKPVPSAPSASALPTDLDALRELSFEDRHTGLASASGDVPVELHVGLDLVQAQESAEPCRTFSDALSIIESSEDPATFEWAVDEATVPNEDDAPSCKGLSERLAAARGPSEDVEAPKPRPRTNRGNTRASKPRPSRPSPAGKPTPPAEPPEKAAEPAKPNPPPAREPSSVATKLDDDLRGLGE